MRRFQGVARRSVLANICIPCSDGRSATQAGGRPPLQCPQATEARYHRGVQSVRSGVDDRARLGFLALGGFFLFGIERVRARALDKLKQGEVVPADFHASRAWLIPYRIGGVLFGLVGLLMFYCAAWLTMHAAAN